MNHAIKCKCGKFSAQLGHAEKSTRITCYCKDCRAFAHYLGRADDMLDAQGGSSIIVTHPREITLTGGAQEIACMSLSQAGMLRWYARCCNTPIGNTSRNHKLAYVGLSAACLADPGGIERDFGPVRMRSVTESAKGPVAPSGIKALPVLFGFAAALLGARLSGSYARNPFFKPGTGEPLTAPTVLDKEARERLSALD